MIGEKRVKKLFNKAVGKMQSLAGISSSTTVSDNQIIQLRAYTMIWELKQDYRGHGSPSYMTKKAYNRYLKRIKSLKDKIVEDKHKNEALEATGDLEEYLSILADNLIRDTSRPRVY